MSPEPAAHPNVLIVIVNYRTPALTISCLRSLSQHIADFSQVRVSIVDNDSGDGSAAAIEQAIVQENWNDWAKLMRADRNGGFSYGNNVAIRPALAGDCPPDYIWLLNSDTEIRAGALQALLDFMQERPQVGICGSRFEEPDGTPWMTAFRFPTILGELENGFRLGLISKLLSRWRVAQTMTEQPTPVDWLPGASMLIRRQVFETIGLMDEGYFLYYEETDFCLQAARQGWECWYVPASHVMHLAGQSTGVTTPTDRPKRLPQYWFDSRRRYFVKNHGWLYAAIGDMVWLLGFALWRVRRPLQRKPDTDPPLMLQDFLRHSTLLNRNIPDSSLVS